MKTIIGKIRNKLQTNNEFGKNGTLFIYEACVGTTVFNLTTGAFIAGLAVYLGANDSICGLLGVIPMMAGMAQIFAPLLLERLSHRKAIVVFFIALYKLIISSVVFIPLFVTAPDLRIGLLLVFVILAYFCLNLVFPGFSSWLRDTVPERSRGRYFGIKDSYALTFTTIICLAMGYVLDSFKATGNESPKYTGFLIVFSVALVLAVINIVIFLKTKEPEPEPSAVSVKLLDCFVKPMRNKAYMKVVVFYVLWNFGLNIGFPFLPVYQVKYLNLDYKYIMLLNLISNLAIVFTVRRWGNFADRYSWAHSAALSIGGLALTHFLWGFIAQGTLIYLPLLFVLNGASWGGINISMFNLPFVFAPKQNKTIYLGFNAAVGGISGLAATLVGGLLVSKMEGKVLNLGYIVLNNIQAAILISSFILMLCALFGGFKLIRLIREA